MFDLLRKYMDSLMGITEMPRERAEKLVRDLQERGEIRARDIRKATEDLVERSVRNRRELVGLVQKEIRRQIRSLGLATREDVDKLARRVKTLESQSRSSKKTTARKKTTAKRTSGGKSTSSPGSQS